MGDTGGQVGVTGGGDVGGVHVHRLLVSKNITVGNPATPILVMLVVNRLRWGR